jgi:hypothetical protein
MHLNELTGVKKYHEIPLHELIAEVMAENGFEKIGKGMFGVAYKRPADNYVYKLYIEDYAYSYFIKYAQEHSSPFFPKIHGFKTLRAFWKRLEMDIDEKLMIAKVEYVTPMSQIVRYHPFLKSVVKPGVKQLLNATDQDQYDRALLHWLRLMYQQGIDGAFSEKVIEMMEEWSALAKISHHHPDAHTGNYGMNSEGDLKMIDPLSDPMGMGYDNPMLDRVIGGMEYGEKVITGPGRSKSNET